ncbi:MAG TPA: NADH-quinone oxidoreductase subunit L, partial [Acidimicrobiia bacterium]
MTDLAIDLLWLVILLPLAGAVFLHFVGQRLPEPLAGVLASAAIGGAFLVSLLAAIPFFRGDMVAATLPLWDWMPAIGAGFELLWDPLSALMALVVTGVGFLIHVFAIGYMHGDERFGRFFFDLNLFAASMLTLVLAGNYAMLFLGWELVGLCSYLLIGFWFTRDSAAGAAKKAFVVNRIGDFGMMVALMLVFAAFGTLSYAGIFERAEEVLTTGVATTIGLLFLLAAAGKSAQIPLYVWLPDAMEGPTPVSALIHAATMVTAGVFMVARLSPMFEYAPVALAVVAIVGASTAFFAATIGICQNDIKRVIAYSTCSQLGYMFFACGVSAYAAGIFHLFTHAFFKALLFLGAGSVIHGMSAEQDMRRMGGIWRMVPVTYTMMWIGSLALAGVPFFAGYYSKDTIIEAAFGAGTAAGQYAFWLGVAAAFMTALYSWRLIIMTFHGKPRASEEVMHHVHESPRIMLVPLILLAVGAVFSGVLAYDTFVGEDFREFWHDSILVLPQNQALEAAHHAPLWVQALTLIVAVV